MCLEPAGRETAAELAPLGREKGARPLNSCVELDGWITDGLEVLRMVEGPSVADLLSLEGEGGAERELVACVTPMLRARDFCLSCKFDESAICRRASHALPCHEVSERQTEPAEQLLNMGLTLERLDLSKCDCRHS